MTQAERVRNRIEAAKTVATDLAVDNDDKLGLISVFLVCRAAVNLREDVCSGNLRMLHGLDNLLLFGPIDHVTNRIDVGMRLELKSIRNFDLSACIEHTRTKGLHKTSSGAVTICGNLEWDTVRE